MWGGLEHRVLVQTRWLCDHGHAAHIATPSGGETWTRATAQGLSVLPIDFVNASPLANAVALRRLVRAFGITVIDTHANVDGKAALACLGRSTVVRTAHVTPTAGSGPLQRLRWRSGCHAVIATSQSIFSQLDANGFLRPGRSTVVGEWAETEFFDVPSLEDYVGVPVVTIALVGMLRPEKGIDVAIAAMGILRDHGVSARLVIAGEAPAEHRPYAARLGTLAGETVEFYGYVDPVSELLAHCQIVVIPSRRDAQSRIAAQAMAAGRPVVASDVGGLGELVRSGETGWLVPPDDPAALAARLQELVLDRALRERFGAAGRRTAQRELRLDAKMALTMAAYASRSSNAMAAAGLSAL